MPFDVERLLRLWTDPLPEDDDAAADAFRQLYADPVPVNGVPLTAADLVARARAMQRRPPGAGAGGAGPRRHARCGRGRLPPARPARRTAGHPVGRLPATRLPLDLRVIDILSLSGGRIERDLDGGGLADAARRRGSGRGAPAAGGRGAGPSAHALELTETIPQPAEALWAWLVEPAGLARWWGPHGFTTSAERRRPARRAVPADDAAAGPAIRSTSRVSSSRSTRPGGSRTPSGTRSRSRTTARRWWS